MRNSLKHVRRLVGLASVSAMTLCGTARAQNDAHIGVETVLAPGARDGCPTLQLLNAVPLAINNDQLTLPADVNGKTRSFQFDTAAITEQMTEAAAVALGLHPATPDYGGPRVTGNLGEALSKSKAAGAPMQQHGLGNAFSGEQEIYDARGRSYSSIATVADFTMRTMENTNVDFHISPLPPPDVDGVLSLGLFDRFDIDLNFSAHRFNLFSKDHCAGKILYWRAPVAAALPFITRENRLIIHVMLEGKELTAVVDTGSPVSVLRFEAAARLFGIAPDSAGLTLVADRRADARQGLYAHDFKTLSFGTVAIGDPRVLLTRSSILVQGSNPNVRTGSLIANDAKDVQPDMIIGMDILKQTHLYIAMRERVLYVTQGTELAPDAAGAQPVIPVSPFRP